MDSRNSTPSRFFGRYWDSLACKCVIFVMIVLVFRAFCLPSYSGYGGTGQTKLFTFINQSPASITKQVQGEKVKFLEVPQIVWGLNNQKIAFARACLTARMLNRTLLMPNLSASLFYKEVELLKPISFEKVFQFDRFNSHCKGFVQLGRYGEVSNGTDIMELQKGSGRRWTIEKDLDQLRMFNKHPLDQYEIIRIVGKNPFLWRDHWPVKDYAKVFQCLLLVEEISREADKVVTRIKEIGLEERRKAHSPQNDLNLSLEQGPYVAVHMRIEKDWMIHCKKLEQRLSTKQICSSKEQIMQRVGNILRLKAKIPIVVYLAVADDLLEDNSVVSGWNEGLLPYEKKRLGVLDIYKKHPYLIQSAIDYEVCLRADMFVGNSFSTFSSLIVLDRTQKMIAMGITELCGMDVRWPSYAYNIGDESGGPHPWATNMSDLSLQAISYGVS
ncbi:O-fucosyltransferase 23-like isoform X2 [Andrographis paniculata]|uniref:O-fucosyltransferase 23-like isoform X2 n=1 Tax=Andrographis paniculata TaxID=175694 RepID=UPI0021E70481|nr:O-fucosyltransferase 23-like isoform X2 [Andrographis paniculata]